MANTPSSPRHEDRFGKSQFEEAKSKTQQAATTVGEKAKEAAASATEGAKEMASSALQTAKEVASQAGKKADDATTAVGQGMRSLAGTIREKTPDAGMLGSASEAVAGTLESSGRYLEQHGFGDMADDLTNLIRRNPLPAVLIGVGVGFLLGRTFRR